MDLIKAVDHMITRAQVVVAVGCWAGRKSGESVHRRRRAAEGQESRRLNGKHGREREREKEK